MKTQILSVQQIPVEVTAVPDNLVLGSSTVGIAVGLAIAATVTGASIITIKLVKESLDGERTSRSVSMAVTSMLVFVSICLMAVNLVFGPGIRDGNLSNVKENTVEFAK